MLRTMVIPCVTFLSKTKVIRQLLDVKSTFRQLVYMTHCYKVTREISKILVISKENLEIPWGSKL